MSDVLRGENNRIGYKNQFPTKWLETGFIS